MIIRSWLISSWLARKVITQIMMCTSQRHLSRRLSIHFEIRFMLPLNFKFMVYFASELCSKRNKVRINEGQNVTQHDQSMKNQVNRSFHEDLYPCQQS